MLLAQEIWMSKQKAATAKKLNYLDLRILLQTSNIFGTQLLLYVNSGLWGANDVAGCYDVRICLKSPRTVHDKAAMLYAESTEFNNIIFGQRENVIFN